MRFRLLSSSGPLTWANVIDRWQYDSSFRRFFISQLVDVPYAAYFWETPAVTSETVNQEFEFVIVESMQLVGVRANQSAFAGQFAAADSSGSVIEFDNLPGDASLVAPKPIASVAAYPHIREFSHQAPADQQEQLWKLVGQSVERRLSEQPVWVSTSGLGVCWLHVRLDSSPKYYNHEPYRTHRI